MEERLVACLYADVSGYCRLINRFAGKAAIACRLLELTDASPVTDGRSSSQPARRGAHSWRGARDAGAGQELRRPESACLAGE